MLDDTTIFGIVHRAQTPASRGSIRSDASLTFGGEAGGRSVGEAWQVDTGVAPARMAHRHVKV